VRSGAVRAVAGGVLLVGLAAACGGEPAAPPPQSALPDEVTLTPGPDGVQSVEVDADDRNRFHPSLIKAQPGPVLLTLRHVGTGAPHNWLARDLPGARVPVVRGGETRSASFRIGRPGDYRFVCTIHEAQGSVGRIVVESAP
jgi:plastocyanin